jgi:hypothetical protein
MIDALPLLLSDEGYQISRSVRLRSSASAFFSRTPSVTGNRRTWTASLWFKRGTLGVAQVLLGATGSSRATYINLNASNQLQIYSATSAGGGDGGEYITTQVFRDPSAWYHIVIAYDSTQATSTNRIKLWVNGQQATSFATSTAPTLNHDSQFNWTGAAMDIGRYSTSSYVDGYLTEINFIDGQALDPSSFGETNLVTGVWQPKKYAGTYGTNGFYLNFSDNSAATAAAIGKDYSGNGNNWTPNNISVTAGVTYDSMLDVPTQWADGGNGRGNYGTLSPLWKGSLQTLSNGNLTSSKSSGTNISDVWGNFGITSGKWYFECSVTSLSATVYIGVGQGGGIGEALDDLAESATSYYYTSSTGDKEYGGTVETAYGNTYTSGDTIGCAVDMDTGKIWWSKNGTWQASGDPAAGVNAAFTDLLTKGSNAFFAFSSTNGASNSNTLHWNFGQRPFAYTPPTGFKALNTLNLPTPTILKGNQYFDVSTWTGNGASRSITGVQFQPDLVWAKGRSVAYNHRLFDALRSVQKPLSSNTTDAETTELQQLTAFNADGFSLGTDNGLNQSSATYVGWQWKEGPTQGFDIVTYTGTGANRTVAHSLGVAPSMIIVKNRTSGYSYGWNIYHASLGATKVISFDTGAASTLSSAWNDTSPTSSVFSLGTIVSSNRSGNDYVAYLFSEVAGFSRFGSYTGNGSADGTFCFTGFLPKFVMVKRTDSTGNWTMLDSARDANNVADKNLYSNLSASEGTGTRFIDMLSNGFKIRGTDSDHNTNGGTYIFAAFSETAFKFSLGR